MKKLLFILFFLPIIVFGQPPTIFCDDFESYSNGSYLVQSSSNWITWSGGSGTIEDVQITNVLSNSPPNSIFFNGTGSGGGPQDIVLPFGPSTPYTSGYFNFSAEFYVVNGAYFNFQADNMPGNIWALDVIMDNGTINFGHYAGTWTTLYLSSTYPSNQWFELRIEINLTSNLWEVFVDNVSQGTFANSTNQIASLDLYPLSGHQFYTDDVCFVYNSTSPITYGCIDLLACNYNSLATFDDGSCVYPTASTDVQTACDSYTWIDGVTYTASSSTATYTITNTAGCDSVITLDLTVINSSSSTDVQTACDSYTWIDGITYIASNSTATYTTTNAAGCDSTHILNLTINYSNTVTSSVIACDSYAWNGITYKSSGSYTYTTTNSNGCDSTATLNLTINSASSFTITLTECDSYAWNGNIYTASGSYDFVTTNINGCDSTATLNLTINNSIAQNNALSICYGDSIVVGNNIYILSGTYNDVLNTVNGCDSTITTNLTVVSEITAFISQNGSDLLVNALGGNTPYAYHWNTGESTQQITPTVNGTYWVIIEDANQCFSDTFYYDVTWIPANIAEVNISDINVYPNPSDDIFNIEFSSLLAQDIQVSVLNAVGEVVFIDNLKSHLGAYHNQISLKEDAHAVYFLKIQTREGTVSKKLVLN